MSTHVPVEDVQNLSSTYRVARPSDPLRTMEEGWPRAPVPTSPDHSGPGGKDDHSRHSRDVSEQTGRGHPTVPEPKSRTACVGSSPTIMEGWRHVMERFQKKDAKMLEEYYGALSRVRRSAFLSFSAMTPFVIVSMMVLRSKGNEAETWVVFTSSLWVVSFISNLLIAHVTLLGNQWLYTYSQWDKGDLTPEEKLFLRYDYQETMHRWHVSKIIGSWLPRFQNVTLVLFFTGLAICMWKLTATYLSAGLAI